MTWRWYNVGRSSRAHLFPTSGEWMERAACTVVPWGPKSMPTKKPCSSCGDVADRQDLVIDGDGE